MQKIDIIYCKGKASYLYLSSSLIIKAKNIAFHNKDGNAHRNGIFCHMCDGRFVLLVSDRRFGHVILGSPCNADTIVRDSGDNLRDRVLNVRRGYNREYSAQQSSSNYGRPIVWRGGDRGDNPSNNAGDKRLCV